MPLGAVVDPTEVPLAMAAAIGLTGPLGDRPLAPVVKSADRSAVAARNGQLRTGWRRMSGDAVVVASPPARLSPFLRPAEFRSNYRSRRCLPSRPWVAGRFRRIPSRVMRPLSFSTELPWSPAAYALTEHNARTLGEICDVLHGLPLAIELAASWIPVLSPRDLLDHLRQADTVLTSDTALVEERHRSLAMILDSSWSRLSASERTALSALAIFVGGFTREAAEAVAGAGLGVLAALVERSLIQRLPDARGWVSLPSPRTRP